MVRYFWHVFGDSQIGMYLGALLQKSFPIKLCLSGVSCNYFCHKGVYDPHIDFYEGAACVYVHIYIYIYSIHTYVYIHIHIFCVYMCMHMCMFLTRSLYIYIYVYRYLCLYVYMHRIYIVIHECMLILWDTHNHRMPCVLGKVFQPPWISCFPGMQSICSIWGLFYTGCGCPIPAYLRIMLTEHVSWALPKWDLTYFLGEVGLSTGFWEFNKALLAHLETVELMVCYIPISPSPTPFIQHVRSGLGGGGNYPQLHSLHVPPAVNTANRDICTRRGLTNL